MINYGCSIKQFSVANVLLLNVSAITFFAQQKQGIKSDVTAQNIISYASAVNSFCAFTGSVFIL